MWRVLGAVAFGAVLAFSVWVGKDIEGAPSVHTTTTLCKANGTAGATICVDESGTSRTRGHLGGNDVVGSMYVPLGTPTLPCPADLAPWTACVLNQSGHLVRADVEVPDGTATASGRGLLTTSP